MVVSSWQELRWDALPPYGASVLACLAFAYLAAMLAARIRDRRTLIVVERPAWMRKPSAGWTFGHLFLFQLRDAHVLLRIAYVAPPWTAYSRAQLVHCFFLYLTVFLTAILVIVGAQQCYLEQAALAGLLSAIPASGISILGRLLFRCSYNTGRRKEDRAARLRELQCELQQQALPRATLYLILYA